jgi:hypothetical protein
MKEDRIKKYEETKEEVIILHKPFIRKIGRERLLGTYMHF